LLLPFFCIGTVNNSKNESSGEISRVEAHAVFQDSEALSVFASLHVDVSAFADHMNMKFAHGDHIKIQEIMKTILMLCGHRDVKVQDLIHNQAIQQWNLSKVKDEITKISEKVEVALQASVQCSSRSN